MIFFLIFHQNGTDTGMPNMLSISQAAKINRSGNFIGLSFIMLVTQYNYYTMANHEGGVHFRTISMNITLVT